jgi:hypothetical protein
MNNPIWNIGLFKRFSSNKAEWIEYKEKNSIHSGLTITDGSVKSLIYHLQIKTHKGSEYEKKYNELISQKNRVQRTASSEHRDNKITGFLTSNICNLFDYLHKVNISNFQFSC